MRLDLRPAELADADAVLAVLEDTYRGTWRPQLTAAAIEAIRREDRFVRYVGRFLGDFRLAIADGEVAGMVHHLDGFVGALHVAGRFQGRGIGSALLVLAEREMVAAGHTVSRLGTDSFNARSLRFYARHGYREVDRCPDDEWDSGLTTVKLEKTLSPPAS